MSNAENENDTLEFGEEAEIWQGEEALFGSYSVLSPGVQIVLDGRAVSAPQVE
jgi:hypothetical protein